jgi:hypothetical protein
MHDVFDTSGLVGAVHAVLLHVPTVVQILDAASPVHAVQPDFALFTVCPFAHMLVAQLPDDDQYCPVVRAVEHAVTAHVPFVSVESHVFPSVGVFVHALVVHPFADVHVVPGESVVVHGWHKVFDGSGPVRPVHGWVMQSDGMVMTG